MTARPPASSPTVLSNDFFTALTSMDFNGKAWMAVTLDDRDSGVTRYQATRRDLIFEVTKNATQRHRQLSCRRQEP
jgi:catalase (peroxidase I)